MIHLDLFSGIGGFAYAADQVWDDVEHIFCDIEPFAREVLKKHWPESEIYSDIRTITADSYISRYIHREPQEQPAERPHQALGESEPGVRPPGIFLLTGGFPCQPFSAAGLRRGTADPRHLWPEMLRVIRLTQPEWVIAENVRGLVTWNDGMVLEQVCADLEASGYDVQPLVIPAVALNAPHRRDRIWFVANRKGGVIEQSEPAGSGRRQSKTPAGNGNSWDRDWHEVAAELCSVDDGLPGRLGDVTISKSKHRAEQLKAYGNAIVPQIAEEIMRAVTTAASPDLRNHTDRSQNATNQKGQV